MNRLLVVFTLMLSCASTAAFAADSEGRFAVRNAGMATCQQFLDEKKAMSPKLNLYMGWIDGYISAANQFSKGTFDFIPWGNTPFLATLLENYCKKMPQDRFYVAVNKLMAAMAGKRLTTESPMVQATNGENKTYVYQVVLKEVQTYLQQDGFYKGTPDGEYGPATRDALLAFQKANKLRETGLPDQITLYLIYKQHNQPKAQPEVKSDAQSGS